MPWARQVEAVFDELFRRPIIFTFNILGKDSYSKFTKVSVFCLLVIIPLFITVMLSFVNMLVEFLDPAPTLVPV